MFRIGSEGLRIQVIIKSPDHALLTLMGRLIAAGEEDESCPVTVLDGVLGDLIEVGVRHFEIDVTDLTDLDIFGVNLLHRLRAKASCSLILPAAGSAIEPLLVMELITRFHWTVERRVA